MTAKSAAPLEFRISADEFDKMMRGALSAHPAKKSPKKSGRRRKRKAAK
jgi:hypothetical protein